MVAKRDHMFLSNSKDNHAVHQKNTNALPAAANMSFLEFLGSDLSLRNSQDRLSFAAKRNTASRLFGHFQARLAGPDAAQTRGQPVKMPLALLS